MINPDSQGELILSFVRERHESAVQRAAGEKVQPMSFGRTRRLARVAGDILIATGTALRARGQTEMSQTVLVKPVEVH